MSSVVILVCRNCLKGYYVADRPVLHCPRCSNKQWINLRKFGVLDRLRMWWQTGKAPWTTPQSL